MKRLSLSIVLPALIVSLCLGVAAVMAYFSLSGTRSTLLDEAEQKLNVVLEQRLGDLDAHFKHEELVLRETSASHQAAAATEAFSRGWRSQGAPAEQVLRELYVTRTTEHGDNRDVLDDAGDGSEYSAAHADYHSFFASIRGQQDYYDIFLIDPRGNVIYTVYKETDFAGNVTSGPLAQSGLSRVFRKAMQAGADEVVFEEFDPYGPSGDLPSAFLASPVENARGEVIGVYAVQIAADYITQVASNRSGLEETGRVIIVAEDGTRRNGPRFEGDPDVDAPVPMTPQLEAALAGEDGAVSDAVSDKGTEVVAAYDSIGVFGSRWAAIAEQDRAEVLEPMGKIVRELEIEIGIMLLIVIALGWQLGRWVSSPLRRLATAMTGVAERSFDDAIPGIRRKDEIGDVARSLSDFRDMLAEADKTAREVMFKSSAFTGSSVAMLVTDTAGKIIYHNAAARTLFSDRLEDLHKVFPALDPDNLIGVDITQFHTNDPRVQKILSDPAQLPFHTDVTAGDARFSINATAVQDEAGHYVGTVVEWADVAEARMNAGILNAIRRNQTVVEIDMQGAILEVNDVFLSVYGFERRDVIGKSFDMLMPKGSESVSRMLHAVTAGGHVNEKSCRVGKGGREIWLESSINGIADQSGKVFKLIEIAADVTEAQKDMNNAQARREEMEAAQRAVVDALKTGLSGLAAGDLTHDIPDPFSSEYEELRADFNAAVHQLRDVLSLVVETSGNIRSGASEISQAADDLSRRTESQAATLEETAAAMDELTESVKSAAGGATEADRVVRDAREKAEVSGVVVVDAVNAMSEIEKSSQQISQIIGVIDDIAFQTNLLALNAGVEAARAGEAGRGFAVVASEVRALAQRSSEAAKEIKQLISTSSRFVENGVDLVGQAGEALKTIVSSVTEISGLVSEIASSSKEQATGLTEINSGVTMLDQVTQQNAAMVEESTAASHSLRQEAEGLTELVSRFRLGSGAAAGEQPAPMAAAPAPVKAAGKRKKAVGDDWSHDAAMDGDDGWESF